MGVYHFMGLGRSIGAVTASISYLGERFTRWNQADQKFFELSGEIDQLAGQKPGDVEAIILFTTPEIRRSQVLCEEYILNRPGHMNGQTQPGEPVPNAVRKLLSRELQLISGGRKSIKLYYCDIARDRPTFTFERVATVLTAAKPPGRIGKEIWINLTGGSNIINAALQLAATLTGTPARLYYLISDNDDCIRHTVSSHKLGTPDDHFWVELPIVYLNFSVVHRHLLEELATMPQEKLLVTDLHNRLQNDMDFPTYTGAAFDDRIRVFERLFLLPLKAQRLIIWYPDNTVAIGPDWELLSRYYDATANLTSLTSEYPTLRKLADETNWFFQEELEIQR